MRWRAPETDIAMPQTITGSYSPAMRRSSSASLAAEPWLILAAVVVIYIVLGVLYESLIHPVTILSTLPSAGIGALLALMICGIDLSLVALVGIVLLMGIVKKNAIMMVDFAIEAERARGTVAARRDARGLPAALPADHDDHHGGAAGSAAAGAGAWGGVGTALPLGVTIIGGLLLPQFLTLYTTPAIYLAFERLRLRLVGPGSHATAAAE